MQTDTKKCDQFSTVQIEKFARGVIEESIESDSDIREITHDKALQLARDNPEVKKSNVEHEIKTRIREIMWDCKVDKLLDEW